MDLLFHVLDVAQRPGARIEFVLNRGILCGKTEGIKTYRVEDVITTHVHTYDLPSGVSFQGSIAVDTEAMGLNHFRDRLCVVQMSGGDGAAHLVHFPEPKYDAPNLKKLLSNAKQEKIFHFARFDVGILKHYLGIDVSPVYCTRTASRILRTYSDKHGLKEICKELLTVDISKQQQSSDWGSAALSPEQVDYAASDVMHLHRLKEELNRRLQREGRYELAQRCMSFIPLRVDLDLAGWANEDIFAHV